ncbi:unnamed protein product [Meganyctiphanes norvegica]|uniref:Protein quiver n=1 Tax=Meganyctiphanes norvegica TaxID=48144 RepID=A0AAV2QK82_MEGNR
MKSMLVSIVLMALISTGLCIKCYVGKGDVGSSYVTETGGFKTCSVHTIEIGGVSAVLRAGVPTEMTEGGCTDGVIGTETCLCNTDLCNGAPATVHAIMPIIAMAVLVKLIV